MAFPPKKRKRPGEEPDAQAGPGQTTSLDVASVGSKALDMLFPARRDIKDREARMVELPTTSSGYFEGILSSDGQITDVYGSIYSVSADEEEVIHVLPKERVAKYGFLDAMTHDPTIACALEMHIGHALSQKADTGEVFSIEPAGDKEDPIVDDLRTTFKDMLHREVHEWAYGAAVKGVHYCRVYGDQGVGVTHLRSDFYTHPRFIREYEQAGRLAGFACAHHGESTKAGIVRLLEPWKFVGFKIPHWKVQPDTEPFRVNSTPVDLGEDDFTGESLVETQDYGTSLVETAYSPWIDLLEAILSMNMSRKNAARLERLIGVNTGRLDPKKASQYLNLISGQILNTDKELAKKSIRRGFVQTVLNHIIPIFGDTKGRLDVNTIQGTPDITGLEDVNFHVKRLGSALGVDPALLGFGEMLSGGLGDGGFFRISIMASIKAQLLRRAIQDGIERIFEIHVAYKHGKVFLPHEKPWRIAFNSVNTAMEREEQENREARANYAGAKASIVQTLDPESFTVDKRAFFHSLFVDDMKTAEEKFDILFPPGKEAPENVPSMGAGGTGLMNDPDYAPPEPEPAPAPVAGGGKPAPKKPGGAGKVMESASIADLEYIKGVLEARIEFAKEKANG